MPAPYAAPCLLAAALLLVASPGCRSSADAGPKHDVIAHRPHNRSELQAKHNAQLEESLRVATERLDASPDDLELLNRAARLSYYLAVDRSAYIDPARARFERLRRARPTDAPARAYLGSLTLVEAADSINPLPGIRHGLREMDAAVADAQTDTHETTDLETRFVRARTRLELPSFFNGGFSAADEFAGLADRVRAAVLDHDFSPQMAANTLYHHGVFRWQANDLPAARAAWADAIRLAPDSLGGEFAAQALDALGRPAETP